MSEQTMTGFDWTRYSADPNHKGARADARRYLSEAQVLHTDCDLIGYVLGRAAGKRVLDIGVAEHAMNYLERDGWRHARIASVASYCLGLDILEPMVKELQQRGFNVRCADATGDQDLGERFDLVFIGDVLEHVNDAAALLRFAARHLAPGGRILASTPNPFSRKFIRQFQREGAMVVNLDHVAWITPTMALELARRAGMKLAAYHLIKPIKPFDLWLKRNFSWRFAPAELSFPDYLYEFAPLAE